MPIAGVLTVLLACSAMVQEGPGSAAHLENLALRAHPTASSEYDERYLARFAVDGEVPGRLCQEDRAKAWAIRGAESGYRGTFTLRWDEPVELGEVVYYGRTAMLLEECFEEYELYLGKAAEPVVRGTLARKHGPQRIPLPRSRTDELTLKFLSAYTDRYNPGASEIAVFASSPSDEQLAEMSIPASERTPGARALAKALHDGDLGFRDLLVIQRHHLSLSHVYTYHVEGYRPGGGLYVWSPGGGGGELRQLVDSTDGEIIDADLSYDGTEVVFSWKRGGAEMVQPNQLLEEVDRSVPDHNYQVYRVKLDGTGLTRLTSGTHNNLNASWLADGGLVFISDRKPAYAYCFVTTSPVLYRMERDGSQQQRLSANYLMDFTPSVLADGRIIFTRWEYVDRPACPIQSLWSINPDGTGLAGYYGNRVLAPGTFMDAQPIPGTQKVLALATNHNGDCRGAICVIDRTKGSNAREAVTNVTPEVDLYAVGGVYGNGLSGPYEKPFPIDDGRYLVSRMGVLQLRDYGGNAVSLLHPEDGLGWYSAQPVRSTEVPPRVANVRIDESVELAEDGSVSGAWATVMMQDVYRGLEPAVERGEVKEIVVVQEIEKSTFTPLIHEVPTGQGYASNTAFGYQFPLVSCGATYSPKKVWGTAKVAEDGSACFRVPSEVPLYFLALDAEGRAVQRMRTFTHLMPGEVQGCVGCHADRNEATPTRGVGFAMSRQPQELEPPAWGVKGFLYPEVVQPVLDQHCVECHNEREHPGGVDLSGDQTDFFSVSYDVLARKGTMGETRPEVHNARLDSGEEGESPYTSWIWTINGTERNILQIEPKTWGSPVSRLAELIRDGHPDEHGAPRVTLSEEERRRIYLWIDLNVPYYGTSASNHPDRMGSRRMLPPELEGVLAEVAAVRCVECHESGVPSTFYTRMLQPENNDFLLAPLALAAGGTEACGRAVFASREDPDYQRLLELFRPIQELLAERPRADLPAFVPPDCAMAPERPGTAQLVVSVLDAERGEPVRGALVIARWKEMKRWRTVQGSVGTLEEAPYTDRSGIAKLEVPAGRELDVEVVSAWARFNRRWVDVGELSTGAVRELPVTVTPRYDSKFYGRVVATEDGSPIAGAVVRSEKRQWYIPFGEGETEDVPLSSSAISDRDGCFDLAYRKLDADEATISAAGRTSEKVVLGRVGATPWHRHEVRLGRAACLEGMVTGALARAGGLRVSVSQSLDGTDFGRTREWSAPVAWGGWFSIEGLPSNEPLRVEVRRGEILVRREPEAMTLAPWETRPVEWDLGGGTTIQGRVLGQILGEDDVLEPPRVAFLFPASGEVGDFIDGPFRDRYLPNWVYTSGPAGGRVGSCDDQGRFAFTEVAVGEWMLWAYGGYGSVSSVTRLTIQPEEGSVEVTVRLLRGEFIAGHVLGPSGIGAEHAEVSVTGQTGGFRESAGCDEEGGFRVGPLPPGRYDLLASEPRFPASRLSARAEIDSGAADVVLRLTDPG